MSHRTVAAGLCALVALAAAVSPLAPPADAADELYGWALSASATDPFVQTAPPLPEPGLFELWLWLVCHEADGIAAAELGLTLSEGLLVAEFSSDYPAVINFGDGLAENIILGIGGCPTPPFRVGRFHLIDFGDGGTVCVGPSAANGRDVSVDCSYPQPTAYPDAVLGFSSDGSAPCVVGDCVDLATSTDERDLETSTWGRVKGTCR